MTGRFLLIRMVVMFSVSMLTALVAGHFWHSGTVFGIALGLSVGSSVYVSNMILFARLRPEISRFIGNHDSEIAVMA